MVKLKGAGVQLDWLSIIHKGKRLFVVAPLAVFVVSKEILSGAHEKHGVIQKAAAVVKLSRTSRAMGFFGRMLYDPFFAW